MAPVEPPEGFLRQAVDHRPLFAGRTLVALAGASVAVAAALTSFGGFDGGASNPGTVRATEAPVDNPPSGLSAARSAVSADSVAGLQRSSEGWFAQVRQVADVVSVELGFPTLD